MAVRGTASIGGSGGGSVDSVSGTAFQVTASPTTGDVVVGLAAIARVTTSLAIAGATIGSNALAVTGTAAISGALTAASFNGNTFTTGTGVLTIAAAKTLTASNTLTFTGTDGSSVAFGAGGTVLYSGGSGFVSSVASSFTGGIVSVAGSPITSTGTLAFTVAGTSGGIPYFNSSSTWATSAALAANALVIGGGAGAAPATTTTGTGVVTALGVNVGSAGAFVVNGGALGTPASGTLTNTTGFPAASLAGLGTGVATWLATPSSANLATAVTDETGSGALVFGTAPTIASGTFSGTRTITGGNNITSLDLGTISTGTTQLVVGDRPQQYMVNGGAHTLSAPANDGNIILYILNNGSAGTITWSGFTVGANTGDALTTTNTSKFMVSIMRVNSISTYIVKALQ